MADVDDVMKIESTYKGHNCRPATVGTDFIDVTTGPLRWVATNTHGPK